MHDNIYGSSNTSAENIGEGQEWQNTIPDCLSWVIQHMPCYEVFYIACYILVFWIALAVLEMAKIFEKKVKKVRNA